MPSWDIANADLQPPKSFCRRFPGGLARLKMFSTSIRATPDSCLRLSLREREDECDGVGRVCATSD